MIKELRIKEIDEAIFYIRENKKAIFENQKKERTKKLDLLSFRNLLVNHIKGKSTKKQLKKLDYVEASLALAIREHQNECKNNEPCAVENVYYQAMNYIDFKKKEVIATKTFWEHVISNPVGLGILLIGIGNLMIAILRITGLST